MSTFGDFDPDDAADIAAPDGEALARLFVILRKRMSGDPDQPATLDECHPFERALLLYVFTALAARLADELGLS